MTALWMVLNSFYGKWTDQHSVMEGGREGGERSEGDKSKSLQGVLTGVRAGVNFYSSRRKNFTWQRDNDNTPSCNQAEIKLQKTRLGSGSMWLQLILTPSVQVFIFHFYIFIYFVLNILPYKENDSPQPQVPEIFGLLNTNSEDNLLSMKSISVPVKKQIVIIKQSSLLLFM